MELSDIRVGDRVRVASDAPVSLARTSDRLGTVVAARPDYARPLTAWVDSQACEFDFDHTEVTLVARAVYLDAEEQARIKNAMALLDERGLWMASGHLKEILKKASIA